MNQDQESVFTDVPMTRLEELAIELLIKERRDEPDAPWPFLDDEDENPGQ